jgi:hypothetical protein
MILTSTSTFSLLSLVLAGPVKFQINGIDMRDIIEETEHILVDNDGPNSDGFVNVVTPCSNYSMWAFNLVEVHKESGGLTSGYDWYSMTW